MFKKLFHPYKILFFIILLAAILRFYNLGQNPPSLTWDEAAWGYNAYSLGIDGRDEFGRFLPHDYLESFGDFKPPLYAYLDILPVKIFGLNEFSVRFPSALAGILTVLLTYFLTLKIFKSKSIAVLSSFFLAISPWHIMLSRAAFEANVASFLLVLGIWTFLEGVSKKPKYLFFSSISFALSLYTFNTSRVVAPILVIILVICSIKELLRRKKETMIALTIGILLLLPTVKFLFSPQANLRFREVNIFSDIKVIEKINQQIDNDHNPFWSKIIHNRRFAYGAEFIKHYFDNLSPSFLFIKGDGNPKFSTQDVGEMYLFDIIFFVSGYLVLFKKKEGYWWILPLWTFIGILPAATSRETPHALRIETTLPTFQIITAYGFYYLGKKILDIRLKIKYLAFGIFSLLLTFNLFYYLHSYYKHYPFIYSREWQYGYKDSIDYVQKTKDKYDEVYVTTDLGRPYIYYLFYTKTNPQDFRRTAQIKRDSFGFVTVEGFDKYKFVKNMDVKSNNKKQLLVSTGSIPDGAVVLKKINVLDGSDNLSIYAFQ